MSRNLWIGVGMAMMFGMVAGHFVMRLRMEKRSQCGPPVKEVLAELDAGCPGELIFENKEGQCLRMWQMPHRMELWLENQKNIHIEDIYYFDHRTKNEPASIRYYVRYQVLKEGK